MNPLPIDHSARPTHLRAYCIRHWPCRTSVLPRWILRDLLGESDGSSGRIRPPPPFAPCPSTTNCGGVNCSNATAPTAMPVHEGGGAINLDSSFQRNRGGASGPVRSSGGWPTTPIPSKPSTFKSSIFWRAIQRISGGRSPTASLSNPSSPRTNSWASSSSPPSPSSTRGSALLTRPQPGTRSSWHPCAWPSESGRTISSAARA